MKLCVGCELIYDCPQPIPMMLMLHIHHTRAPDIIDPDQAATSSGGSDHRLSRWFRQPVQPARRPQGTDAHPRYRHPEPHREAGSRSPLRPPTYGAAPALGGAHISVGQPVLRNRSSLRDGLASVRPFPNGLGPGAGDLRLRPPPHRLQLCGRPPHQNGVGGLLHPDRRHRRRPFPLASLVACYASPSPCTEGRCQRRSNCGSPAHVVLFGVVHRGPIGETPWSCSWSRWSCLCLHVGWFLFPVSSWCNGSGRDLTTSQLRPSREVPRPRVRTVARSRVAFIAIGSVFCAIFPGKVARS